MESKTKWIIAIILIILIWKFGLIGILFSIFLPSTPAIQQFNGLPERWNNCYYDELLWATAKYKDSNISNIAEINTGKNIFKFVGSISSGRILGIYYIYPTFSEIWNGCTESIDVYKNGNKISTINSYTLASNGGLEAETWGKEYFFYDDDLKKDSYVRLTMATLQGPNCGYYGHCDSATNTFKLYLSNDTFSFNITATKITINNQSLRIVVKNNLNTAVYGDIKFVYSIPTALGTITKEEMISSNLQPGNNILFTSISAEVSQLTSITVTPEVKVSMYSSNFNGLNLGLMSINTIGKIDVGTVSDNPFIINLGSNCNTPADTNCDSIVDRTELGAYINRWINNQATRDELGQAIVAWIGG